MGNYKSFKNRKSTAIGDDGITYDIINALAEVKSNPLYFLFNRSYLTGDVPNKWNKL